MGLSLVVGSGPGKIGVMPSLSTCLVEAGLAAHVEPDLEESQQFSAKMFGYDGLHHVRRLAAHLAQDKPLLEPGSDDPAEDPVVAEYYLLAVPEPGGLLRRVFTRKRSAEKLPFQHLMLHSDSEGYYVPQDFPDVIHARAALKVPGGIVGSSVQLREEAAALVAWLEIPAGLDHESEELWDAAEEPPAQGPKWQRFGRESFGALRLLRAAEHSLKTGAALVFC